MNLELPSIETNATEQSIQYVFVIDAELAHVGGGGFSTAVDY